MKPSNTQLPLFIAIVLATLSGCTFLSPRPKNVMRTLLHLSPSASMPGAVDFVATMDRITGSTLTVGNNVTLLTNGEKAFPAMLAAIDSATSRISMETYIIRLDRVGKRFYSALEAAAMRGVEIRFLCDAVGSRTVDHSHFQTLEAAGVEVRFFNPLKNWTAIRLNNRDHRKILVVDGTIAFMGGLNLAKEYDGNGVSGWRDTAVQLEGPAATQAEQVFALSWSQGGRGFLGKDLPLVGMNSIKHAIDEPFLHLLGRKDSFIPPSPPATITSGTALARAASSTPDHLASTILDMYLLAINSARQRVWITCGYFIPPWTLSRALIRAARRGVDVRLITQGQTDEPTVRKISIGFYGKFLKENILIYEWQNTVLHAKSMVVDDIWSTVGSANLDGRALFLNYEANFAITSKAFAAAMIKQFSTDQKNCVAIDLATWEQRSFKQKAGEIILVPLENQF